MGNMKQVTAAIIVSDNKVLLARRDEGERLSGFWEFPGGKIEGNESPQSCLERELQEELGLETKAYEVLAESQYHYEHGSFYLLALRTEIIGGEIELNVHDAVEWVSINELMQYKLAPADIPIAEKLKKTF